MRVILKGTEPSRTLYSVLYSFVVDEDDDLCNQIDHMKEEKLINPLNIPIRLVEKLLDENIIMVDDIIITKYRWSVNFE